MKHMKKMGTSVIATWLITYIITLLFPFLISLILFFFSSGIIEEQCLNSNQLISTSMALKVDQFFLGNKTMKEKMETLAGIRRLAEMERSTLLDIGTDISAELHEVRRVLNGQDDAAQ